MFGLKREVFIFFFFVMAMAITSVPSVAAKAEETESSPAPSRTPPATVNPALTGWSGRSLQMSDYAARAAQVSNIPHIQSKIQQIIEMNKRVTPQMRDQVQSLSRIERQAKTHQRLLDDLQKEMRQRENPVSDQTSVLIQQEKLNLIQKEIDQNYQRAKEMELQDKDPSSR